MNIQTLALLLLIGQLISEIFIISVLRRQWQIRKSRTHPRLIQIRRVLMLLALLVFLGNLYPMALDAIKLFYPGVRTTQTINPAGAFYAISTNLTFMFASILIWLLYKLADVVIEVAELIGIDKVKDSIHKQ